MTETPDARRRRLKHVDAVERETPDQRLAREKRGNVRLNDKSA